MGFSGIGIAQLLIVLLIIIVLFGTKRLTAMGEDIGKGLKSFRKAMHDDDTQSPHPEHKTKSDNPVVK